MKIIKNIFILGIAAIMTGCGSKSDKTNTADNQDIVEIRENAPGDSTLYGLACDGCTDSVVVILPYSGGDPDTFDIVNAARDNKIFGEPRIGCRLALTINPARHDEARQVIVLDDLEQQWRLSVMPEIIGEQPDSLVKKLMVPHEYSYYLKRDNQMYTTGNIHKTGTTDEQTPVEYPQIRQYNKWSIFNGKLILAFDRQNTITAENDSLMPHVDIVSDTAEIVYLASDSLVLKFKEEQKEFYR